MHNQEKFQLFINKLGLGLLVLIFLVSFYIQFVWHDLPCPLCLLQRIAFSACGIALMFNLFIEIRPRHYGMLQLAALLGFSSSVRQILLHIVPNDPGYGPPIFGIHIYTWSCIIFAFIIICSSLALFYDRGFHKTKPSGFTKALAAIFLLMIIVNAVSVLMECGLGVCPANPTSYKLLS